MDLLVGLGVGFLVFFIGVGIIFLILWLRDKVERG